ncbi:Sec-independent protein translocase protein TatB [Marinobacter sp. X15-166B]|uniref:Sec-independent protein translocase protein TatB n=1 Tax=Marinobacter sp. X15-166B TaxID=1897620 RepID=UPI0009F3FFBF|nr:Sec-independent protein translocase protein TatB [Marinobacter sp. X15-166B]
MFDIGFLELMICGVIALLVLGPERLPGAARTAGRWVGRARSMVSQFSTELDRQLQAEELREQLRQAGDVGLDDVKKTVTDALDEAKKFEHFLTSADLPANASPAAADTAPASRDDSGPTADQIPASPTDSAPDSRK